MILLRYGLKNGGNLNGSDYCDLVEVLVGTECIQRTHRSPSSLVKNALPDCIECFNARSSHLMSVHMRAGKEIDFVVNGV